MEMDEQLFLRSIRKSKVSTLCSVYQLDFTMDLCLQPHPLCLWADHHYDHLEVLSEINPDILVILIGKSSGIFNKKAQTKSMFSAMRLDQRYKLLNKDVKSAALGNCKL